MNFWFSSVHNENACIQFSVHDSHVNTKQDFNVKSNAMKTRNANNRNTTRNCQHPMYIQDYTCTICSFNHTKNMRTQTNTRISTHTQCPV